MVSLALQTWYIYLRNFRAWISQPGQILPAVFINIIFMVVFVAAFDNVSMLPGFPTDSYVTYLMPMIIVQAMIFSGIDAGFNLLTDDLSGYLNKLLLAPIYRISILLGVLLVSATGGGNPGSDDRHRGHRHGGIVRVRHFRAAGDHVAGDAFWRCVVMFGADYRDKDAERSGDAINVHLLPPGGVYDHGVHAEGTHGGLVPNRRVREPRELCVRGDSSYRRRRLGVERYPARSGDSGCDDGRGADGDDGAVSTGYGLGAALTLTLSPRERGLGSTRR